MTPMLGSMVQKGKFAACAFALPRALKRVDLPTLGRPTMPACKACHIYTSDAADDVTLCRFGVGPNV